MGERIYTAEDAEALAAAATPGPWTSLPLYGVSFDATRGVVSLTVSEEDADLMIAAHDLARSVAHHARRANEAETVLSLAETAAREMQTESAREIRRLRQGIAQVEMVTLPNGRIHDELCPFCRVVAWRLGRAEDRAKHRPGCLWVWAQREVSGG